MIKLVYDRPASFKTCSVSFPLSAKPLEHAVASALSWPDYCADSDPFDGVCYGCSFNAKGGPGAFQVECVHPLEASRLADFRESHEYALLLWGKKSCL